MQLAQWMHLSHFIVPRDLGLWVHKSKQYLTAYKQIEPPAYVHIEFLNCEMLFQLHIMSRILIVDIHSFFVTSTQSTAQIMYLVNT